MQHDREGHNDKCYTKVDYYRTGRNHTWAEAIRTAASGRAVQLPAKSANRQVNVAIRYKNHDN
jgi:hypothetical protein